MRLSSPNPTKPAKPPPHTIGIGARVCRQLEHDIATGRLPPGSRLDVKSVAERFDISRTPAREALLQLATAGLIDFQPRRGGIVITLDPRDVMAMVEVLVVLEAQAAQLAARRMNPSQRSALQKAHEIGAAAAARGEGSAYADANLQFHELIYRGADNNYLHRQIVDLRSRLAFHRPVALAQLERMRASNADHALILDAILRSDPEAAHLAMTQHIAVGGTTQAELMALITHKLEAGVR